MSCIRKYLQKKYKKILLYCSVYAIVVVFLLFSNIINIFFSFPYTLTYNIDLLKLRGYTACATLIPVILTYFISDFFYNVDCCGISTINDLNSTILLFA